MRVTHLSLAVLVGSGDLFEDDPEYPGELRATEEPKFAATKHLAGMCVCDACALALCLCACVSRPWCTMGAWGVHLSTVIPCCTFVGCGSCAAQVQEVRRSVALALSRSAAGSPTAQRQTNPQEPPTTGALPTTHPCNRQRQMLGIHINLLWRVGCGVWAAQVRAAHVLFRMCAFFLQGGHCHAAPCARSCLRAQTALRSPPLILPTNASPDPVAPCALAP